MNLHTQGQKRYVKMEVMPGLKMHDIKMIKRVIRMAWKIPIKTVILLCDTQDIKTVVNAVILYNLFYEISFHLQPSDWSVTVFTSGSANTVMT